MKKSGLWYLLSRWPIFGLVLGLAALPARTSIADHDDDDDRDRDSRPAIQPPAGLRIVPQKPEKELRDMIRQVDDRRIETTIRKLVSFGTRHTESSQTDPNRGVGAAINYVFNTMQGYAAQSNGRMTVALQTYHQPPVAGAILNPNGVDITNVVATIRGSVTPNRVYVITGHIDTRCTIVTNSACDAPGADDDASGVAVVMETARVLSTHAPESTIVLSAVDGEEQGLFGSDNQAKLFKAANTDIQGMFSNDIVGASAAENGVRDPHRIRLFSEGIPTLDTAAAASTRVLVGGENDSQSRQLSRFVKNVAENEDTDMTIWMISRRDRYLRASDHVSYQRQGYPAAVFREPNETFPHEHQDVRVDPATGVQFGDLIQFDDFQFMQRIARINVATLWSLSQGPGTPKNVQIVCGADQRYPDGVGRRYRSGSRGL